jgi:hypothetical protein
MDTRNIMRIDLTGPSKKKIESLSDKHGMTQVTIMSRIVEWFSQQGSVTQNRILMPSMGAEDRKTTVNGILQEMITKSER